MRLWTKMAFVLLLAPLVASAQYKDIDTAMANITRGFGSGDVQAIISGIATDEQVMLQFPGLVSQSGFQGRDQAAYLLDGLFNKAHPSSFEERGVRKNSAEGLYNITGAWTIEVGGKSEVRDLYITLRVKNDRYSLASVRSASR